jgi:protein involved in polysaccharide export with SLBB domain
VDFEKLYKQNDLSQNVILEDNDIVYINDDKKIIYVFGQVGAEGYIPYKPGEGVEYYIERAGGYSLAADDANTRIIKFNSRGWYEPGQIELQSGDFIYVPKETERPFTENLTIVAQIVGAVTALITTYLLITKD